MLMLFFFGFLALWLYDYLTDESMFVFVNCDSVWLYYIDKRERERVESLEIRENISVWLFVVW